VSNREDAAQTSTVGDEGDEAARDAPKLRRTFGCPDDELEAPAPARPQKSGILIKDIIDEMRRRTVRK